MDSLLKGKYENISDEDQEIYSQTFNIQNDKSIILDENPLHIMSTSPDIDQTREEKRRRINNQIYKLDQFIKKLKEAPQADKTTTTTLPNCNPHPLSPSTIQTPELHKEENLSDLELDVDLEIKDEVLSDCDTAETNLSKSPLLNTYMSQVGSIIVHKEDNSDNEKSNVEDNNQMLFQESLYSQLPGQFTRIGDENTPWEESFISSIWPTNNRNNEERENNDDRHCRLLKGDISKKIKPRRARIAPRQLAKNSTIGQCDFTTELNQDTGQIIYKCTLCSREFPSYKNTREHYSMHMNLNKCNFCSARFSRYTTMRNHCKIKHPGLFNLRKVTGSRKLRVVPVEFEFH